MDQELIKALVKTILKNGEHYPWRMQSIGLMTLSLDDKHETMLHLWDPTEMDGESPMHDHNFDFTSRIIVGTLTNTRFVEDPAGTEYTRFRYPLGDEDTRREDTAKMTGTSTTYQAGDEYEQKAHEMHIIYQQPGTITIIRRAFRDVKELSVCLLDPKQWKSGKARPATPDEVKRMTTVALSNF